MRRSIWGGAFLLLSSVLLAAVQSQVAPPPPNPIVVAPPPPPPPSPPVTDQYVLEVYDQVIANFTQTVIMQLHNKAGQCVQDPNQDWNMAFDYTANNTSVSNLKFLANCVREQEDAPRRICRDAEINFYIETLIKQSGYLKPNINCNSSIYVHGCEPGWACGLNADSQTANTNNSSIMPPRTNDCKPCCDGFFCPRGLTCMIPCPLGAYCRRAKYDNSSSLCVPYNYQLPAGRDLSCGGANVWGLIQNTKEIFCPEGSYCPTTIEQRTCSSGYSLYPNYESL